LEQAIKFNRAARSEWAELVQQAKAPYLPDITYGPEFYQRGQWLDRLPAIDQDTTDLEKLLKESPAGTAQKVGSEVIEQTMRAVFNKSSAGKRPLFAGLHTPPPSFQRGKPFFIVARASEVNDLKMIAGIRLRYRHVNQAEVWLSADLEQTGEDYHATIPADYTDSAFALQYYFQVRTHSGDVWLHPGLEHRWKGQPYFFIQQA
jgi:hypothetical protein